MNKQAFTEQQETFIHKDIPTTLFRLWDGGLYGINHILGCASIPHPKEAL